MMLLALSTLFLALGLVIFFYRIWLDTYWKRRGVYTYSGKHKENINLSFYQELKTKGLKHGGYSKHFRPRFFTIDLDTIKAILIKDADHFLNRRTYNNPKVDPLSNGLLQLRNQDWKNVRSLVSRVFSSGKMKSIFPFLTEHAEIMLNVIGKHAESNEGIEARNLVKKFGMDSLGSCIFGIEIDTLGGNNEDFQEMVENINTINWKRMAESIVSENILKLFRMRISNPKIEQFFRTIINETREFREKNNVKRNDIFEYVQEMTDINICSGELVRNRKLSSEQMMVLLHTFFIGGFETSSGVTAIALFELSLHQDIQDKLRENIRISLKTHGKLTYEAIMDMEYLDWVIKETLRKNPPASNLSRYCNKAYQVPGTDFVLQPGHSLSISVIGIHTDPDYYPEPEKFDPDRFSSENRTKRHPMSFLPFGDGPRNCIGSRLGLILTKVAVGTIISEFRVTLNKKMRGPIMYNPKTSFIEILGGVWLDFSKVD